MSLFLCALCDYEYFVLGIAGTLRCLIFGKKTEEVYLEHFFTREGYFAQRAQTSFTTEQKKADPVKNGLTKQYQL